MGFITLGTFTVSTAAGVALGQYADEGDAIEAALADAMANGDRGPYGFSASERVDVRFLKGFAKPPPVPPIPNITASQSIPDQALTAGVPFSLNFNRYFSGSDAASATYSITEVSGTMASLGLSLLGSVLSGTNPVVGTATFQVLAHNSGYSFASNSFSPTVSAPVALDTLAPSMPMGLNVAVSGTTNAISWEPSADAYQVNATGVSTYLLIRDGATLQIVAGMSAVNPHFLGQDIGTVGITGTSAVDATGVGFASQGAGADIFGTTDAFQYNCANWSADGVLKGILQTLTGAATNGKVGIMFRESNAANASFAAIYFQSGVNNLAFHTRNGTGTSVVQQNVISSVSLPLAVKLVRVGNVLTPYYSTDGNNWLSAGSAQSVSMASSLLAGSLVCSHTAGVLATATVSNLTCVNAPNLSATDTSVPGATHSYSVKARDAVPNTSLSLATVTAFTASSTGIGGIGIKVVGSKFTDLNGNPFIPQGAAVSGSTQSVGGYQAQLAAMTVAQWKALGEKWYLNHIRLPVNSGLWLHNTNGYKTSTVQTINNMTAAGLVVLLDLHWGAPASYNGGIGDGQPGYLSQDTDLSFWTDVATTFLNNRAVVFELFNEPYAFNDGSYTYLKNGSGATLVPFWDQPGGNSGPYNRGTIIKVVGHQQLVTAIRNTGSLNVIVYSCPNWCSDIGHSLSVAPTDPINQLAASMHYNPSSSDATPYNNIQSSGIALWMTEYTKSANTINMAWMQSHGMGYTIWAPSGSSWSYWAGDLVSNYVNTAPWSANNTDVFTGWPAGPHP